MSLALKVMKFLKMKYLKIELILFLYSFNYKKNQPKVSGWF
jgi:hypothetical protein